MSGIIYGPEPAVAIVCLLIGDHLIARNKNNFKTKRERRVCRNRGLARSRSRSRSRLRSRDPHNGPDFGYNLAGIRRSRFMRYIVSVELRCSTPKAVLPPTSSDHRFNYESDASRFRCAEESVLESGRSPISLHCHFCRGQSLREAFESLGDVIISK
ncbi:uncharacterized protein LOC127011061 [Drosophila biarmipes]|uniref:uncharacterized protein LOC127011061 n=1 Tax=Drosophila biarmipes TaxID=125945 RepID=UPI0021CCE77C|nr:uncharacterized protein LOC127011061 [Drosophila biarmipes]